MNTRPFFACAALVVFAAAPAFAVDDSNRDYAFNPPYGYNAFNIDIPPGDDRVMDIAVQASDGKIVLAGYTSTATGSSGVVMRLNADGTVDNGFGTFGRTIFRVNDARTMITSVALESDDKIVLGGNWLGGSGGFVARLSSGGALDPTFADNGINDTDAFGGVIDVALQDSRILALLGVTVLALKPDGQLDGDFGDFIPGYTSVDLSQAKAITLQPDGKILVASTHTGARSDMKVIRLLSNGWLDFGFGTSGARVISFDWCSSTSSPDNSNASTIALAPSGRIVVGGYGWMDTCTEGKSFTLLAALNANGDLDPTFSEDGQHAEQYFSGPMDEEYLDSLTIEPDERILFAGTTFSADGPSHMSAARLLPNGDRDPSFAGDGTGQYYLGGSHPGTYGYAMAMQGAHPIIAGAVHASSSPFDTNFLTIRLVSDRIFADGMQPRE